MTAARDGIAMLRHSFRGAGGQLIDARSCRSRPHPAEVGVSHVSTLPPQARRDAPCPERPPAHRRAPFIARSTSRPASLDLIASRRSYCFFPLANAISTLA